VLGGVHYGTYKVLTVYHTWIHPLHHSPLSLPPPIPRIVSTDILFPFTYMCTQYLHHIHPLTPFPHLLLLPPLPTPPRQDLFHPPVIQFFMRKKRRKKMTFLLVSHTGSFLLAQFGSSPLFFFYLSPFLMVVSTSLKILYSFLHRKYINHIHLLLPSPSCMWPLLSVSWLS
jgi:hypothetical protein